MGLFSSIGKALGAVVGTAVGIGPGAGAAIGGTLGGLADGSGSKKSNQGAITSAQQAEIDAANRIIGLQEQRYGDATRNLTPSISSGNAALAQINDLLGISGQGIYGTAAPGVSTTPWAKGYDNGAYERIAANAPQGVDWAAYVKANPDAMAQWANQTPDLQSFGGDINKFGAFHYVNSGSVRNIDPFRIAATGAGGMSTDTSRQQSAIDALKASPLYQSLFGNGRDAILSASAATGGLRGGNVNAALGDFGRDTLAQVIQQQLQNLGSIQGRGQQAALGLAGISANNANAIGDQIGNIGDATAGGILNRQAVANASDSTIDNLFGSVLGNPGSGGGLDAILKLIGGGGPTLDYDLGGLESDAVTF